MKPPYRVPSMREIEAIPWNGFNVVSTFSGGGGSSLGYRMAGFRVLLASEFIDAARETYRANANLVGIDRMNPGGALIVVEKTEPVGGWLSTVFGRITLRAKLSAGVPPAAILEKELSLGGAQRPIDPAVLGPNAVEFFRFGDFAGYVIARGEDL